MVKILKATSRGQVTLPKSWRDQFDTDYYEVVVKNKELVVKPVVKKTDLEEELDKAWADYKKGHFVSHEDLIKEYGL